MDLVIWVVVLVAAIVIPAGALALKLRPLETETSNDRIGGSTPTIPRSDDNKNAMTRAIALSKKARNERPFRTYSGR